MKSLLIYSVCEERHGTTFTLSGETWDHITMQDKEWDAVCVLIT